MEAEHGLPSYYKVVRVDVDISIQDIKRAYRKLAMQWHPDRWTKTPSLSGHAKRKFQQIQEVYSEDPESFWNYLSIWKTMQQRMGT